MKSNQIVKIILAFSLLLFAVGILLYLMHFKPKQEMIMLQERNRMEEIEKQRELDQNKIKSCLANADRIKKEIDDDNKKFSGYISQLFIDIFYSSKANSCVYVKRTISLNYDGKSGSDDAIYDALTGRLMESARLTSKSPDELIREYKD